MTGLPARPSSGTLRQLTLGEKKSSGVNMSTCPQRYRLFYTKYFSSPSRYSDNLSYLHRVSIRRIRKITNHLQGSAQLGGMCKLVLF